jgi:hypothetical protein
MPSTSKPATRSSSLKVPTIRVLRKSPPDQIEENYLVVAIQHEGNPVLAGLREAYWRQWEGHHIPEFCVTIREIAEKPHPPSQKRP